MIHLEEAIIVEGKYDKIKLSSFIDAVIIETGGFTVFSDHERMELIRKLAQAKGIIIMTDSDSAGFKIRNYLKGALPREKVKHVYIPDIFGKERRKSVPSKEGKLGVEGLQKQILLESLQKAGILFQNIPAQKRKITKSDLYEDGLTGGINSQSLRREILGKLDLPSRLSANMLLDVLNVLMGYDEYKGMIVELKTEKN